jgi:ethanolamine utilization protein EutN
MQLGRVIGSVVATRKVAGLEGVKLLLVQPLTKRGEPNGEVIVAADGVEMAGVGELVYFVSSREASLALHEKFVPVDDAIVGLVDQVDLDKGDLGRDAGDGEVDV